MLGITNVSNAPSIVLKGTQVSDWTSGSYNGYSYRGSIPITGVTDKMIAEVTFSQAQAESGNYSSVCTTYNGGLYIYAKVNTTIEIPSIIIHSIVESYYELDNSPVSGSTKAVTSGGVYSAINSSYPITITSVTGDTVFHSFSVKVGRTVYIGTIFNTSTDRTNMNILKMTCSSPIKPIASSNIPVFTYTQNGDTSNNVHRFVVLLPDENDKKTVYIRVGGDMTLPLSNWQLNFTYLTDE